MGEISFDRFAGVLVAAACADALGAGYEFGAPLPESDPVVMRGQGAFAPGEWTDDTAQMLALALAAGSPSVSLDSPEGEDAVAALLQEWYLSPARLKDIGIHSSAVFSAVATQPAEGLASRFFAAASAREAERPNSSGGNGALMRTAPVVLSLWSDPEAMVRVAMRLGSMTHDDQRSSEACAVWCLAIRRALLADAAWTGASIRDLRALVVSDVTAYLGAAAGEYWGQVLAHASERTPASYYGERPNNGYSVNALAAAWSAVASVPVRSSGSASPAAHLRLSVEAAVRGGGDTDTVACIAGALLGAMWGYSAVPLEWRRLVFGWPDFRDADLLRVADRLFRAAPGAGDTGAWPHADHVDYSTHPDRDSLAVHPFDPGVVLAGAGAAYGEVPLPFEVDAVVSLCRVGRRDLAWLDLDPSCHVEVRLIDSSRQADNPHLALVMADAADTVAALRAAGRRVLLHCVAAQSRTPSVAALYAVRHLGVPAEEALSAAVAALPAAAPASALADVVRSSAV